MRKIRISKETLCLFIILALSAVLNIANLSVEGTANAYYAAGVKSMTKSFKNFFFVAMDPAGYVTIDKPPLGFWAQAISAKIFGFSGFSILLPQALAGVLSTLLLYLIVRKAFGEKAGLLSALFLAITPVFVAVSRNNTIDNLLVFILLLAVYTLINAMQKGSFHSLALSLLLIGLGFNIKQLQSYMILPAVYLTYLLASNIPLKKRILSLFGSTVLLVIVSFSWAVVVDAIPADSRPYVGSSTTNSELELIFGHNGTERLGFSASSNTFGKGGNLKQDGKLNKNGAPGQAGIPGRNGAFRQNGAPGQGGMNLAGAFGAQTQSGLARLFSKNTLSDQIVWFLPLSFLGFLAIVKKERIRFHLDTRRKQTAALFFLWMFPEYIYFSFTTGLFHPHYLTMMAPPVAALAGIGVITMYELYKEKTYASYLLPLSLLITGSVQLLTLSYFTDTTNYIKTLMILLVVATLLSSLLLILNLILKKKFFKLQKGFVLLAIVGLCITPFTGSYFAMRNGVDGQNPAAGLELLPKALAGSGSKMVDGSIKGKNESLSTLIDYITNLPDRSKVDLVVTSASTAERLTLDSDLTIGSLSGFMGNETVMTVDQLKTKVKSGEIRYIYTETNDKGGRSNNSLLTWIKENGKELSFDNSGSLRGTLYDLNEIDN